LEFLIFFKCIIIKNMISKVMHVCTTINFVTCTTINYLVGSSMIRV
jgi:hypothetical protein